MLLADIVRQRHGKFGDDTRPNKGLDPDRPLFVLQGYPLINQPIDIARHGICPTWKKRFPPLRKNHGSAFAKCKSVELISSLISHYINNGNKWNGARAVQGQKRDDVCPIHDLSYPDNHSTNAYINKQFISAIDFTSVVAIAWRIEELAQTYPGVAIKNLEGDVKSTFRHLMPHSEHQRFRVKYRYCRLSRSFRMVRFTDVLSYFWKGDIVNRESKFTCIRIRIRKG
ncbi:LOW QUALITY PROTEIN: hypothetical protein PHMEG_00013685 [Phytophthora megakarya]|uniref:Uncharacterized protein n=1 Tax=Phytophthora megakarya TaxID=4795 RepID=A0A225W7B9_9STRA|nr:LOW QUALITY PROTEIN: hypothetical protein PHMEG_00013685 [Phytophthora megakarya]